MRSRSGFPDLMSSSWISEMSKSSGPDSPYKVMFGRRDPTAIEARLPSATRCCSTAQLMSEGNQANKRKRGGLTSLFAGSTTKCKAGIECILYLVRPCSTPTTDGASYAPCSSVEMHHLALYFLLAFAFTAARTTCRRRDLYLYRSIQADLIFESINVLCIHPQEFAFVVEVSQKIMSRCRRSRSGHCMQRGDKLVELGSGLCRLENRGAKEVGTAELFCST